MFFLEKGIKHAWNDSCEGPFPPWHPHTHTQCSGVCINRPSGTVSEWISGYTHSLLLNQISH